MRGIKIPQQNFELKMPGGGGGGGLMREGGGIFAGHYGNTHHIHVTDHMM